MFTILIECLGFPNIGCCLKCVKSKAISDIRRILERDVSPNTLDGIERDRVENEHLTEFAETFGFKPPRRGARNIVRTYQHGGDKHKLVISIQVSSANLDAVYLNMSLERRKSYGWANYYLYPPEPSKIEDGDFRKATAEVFDRMEEKNAEDLERSKDTDRAGEQRVASEDARKTMNLLRQRVFKV